MDNFNNESRAQETLSTTDQILGKIAEIVRTKARSKSMTLYAAQLEDLEEMKNQGTNMTVREVPMQNGSIVNDNSELMPEIEVRHELIADFYLTKMMTDRVVTPEDNFSMFYKLGEIAEAIRSDEEISNIRRRTVTGRSGNIAVVEETPGRNVVDFQPIF